MRRGNAKTGCQCADSSGGVGAWIFVGVYPWFHQCDSQHIQSEPPQLSRCQEQNSVPNQKSA